jgi:methyltransferase
MFFPIFVSFVILQRFVELFIAKKNEKKMLALGATEYDRSAYKYIVLMHTFFFLSLFAEYYFLERDLNYYWPLFLGLFVAAQVLRYWVIAALGIFWNTRIIILKGSTLIKKGPYLHFRHPNYAAVTTEIAVIPLMFSCFYTAIVFSIINIFVLKRRIEIEEAKLDELTINETKITE